MDSFFHILIFFLYLFVSNFKKVSETVQLDFIKFGRAKISLIVQNQNFWTFFFDFRLEVQNTLVFWDFFIKPEINVLLIVSSF
jgi:uncharacterized membrane protein